tara:strand:+ start:2157 stop:2375 length:219 start_codon:yes stop_codon:yes gene_type:complete
MCELYENKEGLMPSSEEDAPYDLGDPYEVDIAYSMPAMNLNGGYTGIGAYSVGNLERIAQIAVKNTADYRTN